MNTRNTEAIEALHAGIQYLVDKSIASAPFDKIKNGKIVGVNLDGTYKVLVEGRVYNLPSLGSKSLSINEIVKVVVPQNEYSNMFILNTGADGGVTPTPPSEWDGNATRFTPLEYFSIGNSTQDSNGRLTSQNLYRQDGTLGISRVASNPDSYGFYQTIVETFYMADGVTINYIDTYSRTYTDIGAVLTQTRTTTERKYNIEVRLWTLIDSVLWKGKA